MGNLVIRQATVPTLPALHRIFARAVTEHFGYFPKHYRDKVVTEHSVHKLFLATIDSRRVILTATMDGRIVGYAIGAVPNSGPAQLFWLYVEPSHRGANIGLSLLSRMLKLLADKGARSISIATHEHRRYYERQGFKYVNKTVVDGVKLDILTFKVNS